MRVRKRVLMMLSAAVCAALFMVSPAAGQEKEMSTVHAAEKKGYQRPKGYYPITDDISFPEKSGAYNLNTYGYNNQNHSMGMKVVYVKKYLRKHGYISISLNDPYLGKYTDDTKAAVRRFQKKKGLKQTGTVNLATWKKMGYTEKQWTSVSTYVTPKSSKLNATSSRSDYINAMLATAKKYAGTKTRYAWGCSGKPGQYTDCSGFVLQCLYSAGIDPASVSAVSHSISTKRFGSRILACDKKLGKTVSSPKKGDLVFYVNAGNAKKPANTVHVALYAGNGQIYDNWPRIGVKKRPVYFSSNYKVCKYVRIFF